MLDHLQVRLHKNLKLNQPGVLNHSNKISQHFNNNNNHNSKHNKILNPNQHGVDNNNKDPQVNISKNKGQPRMEDNSINQQVKAIIKDLQVKEDSNNKEQVINNVVVHNNNKELKDHQVNKEYKNAVILNPLLNKNLQQERFTFQLRIHFQSSQEQVLVKLEDQYQLKQITLELYWINWHQKPIIMILNLILINLVV